MPAFRTQRLIEFRDTDAAAIMHFSAYFLVMEQAEHAMLRDLGMSVMYPYKDGMVSWPRVSANCDYKSPLRFEEVVDVAVTVAKLGNKSVEYRFDFSRDGQEIATGKFIAVCCFFQTAEDAVSISIPDEIREKLSTYSA